MQLCWSRSYRQFVKDIAGTVRAFGKTTETARANYERFIADNWQRGPDPEPAPIISNASVASGQYDVKTVADVANAYVGWCFEHRSDKHALDAQNVFRYLGEVLDKDQHVINLTASDFAAYRQYCMNTIGARFNKHMRIIKAASRRCRREQWLVVTKGWIEDLLDPLELMTRNFWEWWNI